MMNDLMESEYVRRPDAKGHLKVMELLRKWDPIGVIGPNNQDEYDGYSATIVRMLDASISERELYKFMKQLVTKDMCLPFSRRETKQIAHELIEFWKEWKTEHQSGPYFRKSNTTS